MPTVGDSAPGFEAVDTAGNRIHLGEFVGRTLVLYFYPKDDTPGCTTEACDFRDNLAALQAAGAEVVGVSRDSVASHQKFTAKYSLPFRLIADTDESVCRAYDVIQEKVMYGRKSLGIERTTFVIDGQSVIRARFGRVSVKGHVAAVVKSLADM